MSTNNFKYKNVLVVLPDFSFDNRCLDEDCEHFESEGINCEHVDDYYDFDTEGYNMYKKEMQEKLSAIKLPKCIGGGDSDRYDSDRNYGGTIIYDFSVYNKDGDIYTAVEVVIRNGYYADMNIDYTVNREYGDDNSKLDKSIKVLCNKIEKVLKKYGGKEYLKVAQFSNGEAVYQKVK